VVVMDIGADSGPHEVHLPYFEEVNGVSNNPLNHIGAGSWEVFCGQGGNGVVVARREGPWAACRLSVDYHEEHHGNRRKQPAEGNLAEQENTCTDGDPVHIAVISTVQNGARRPLDVKVSFWENVGIGRPKGGGGRGCMLSCRGDLRMACEDDEVLR